MPPSKVPNSVAKLILELADQRRNPAEIAQILNLKKVQVSTLLAYHKQLEHKAHAQEAEKSIVTSVAEEPVTSTTENEDEPQVESQHVATVDTPDAKLDEEEETTNGSGVYVGDDADYGDAVYWNPQDAGPVPNPHLMIMGESGSGKTYAVQCLVAELAQRTVPSILFDYGQSFELQHLEAPFKRFTGIREHLIGEEGLPIKSRHSLVLVHLLEISVRGFS